MQLTSLPASSGNRQLLAATIEVVRRLVAQFPQLANGGADQKRMVSEWAQGLAGMSSAEVERGMAECRTRRFAPSLGEFAQLCRPALDPEYAWEEARRGLLARERGETGVWSHPAVWRAARTLAYEIKNGSYKARRVSWQMELAHQFEKGWGDDVPPVPKRVEHRPTLTPMPAAIRKKLAELNLKITGARA